MVRTFTLLRSTGANSFGAILVERTKLSHFQYLSFCLPRFCRKTLETASTIVSVSLALGPPASFVASENPKDSVTLIRIGCRLFFSLVRYFELMRVGKIAFKKRTMSKNRKKKKREKLETSLTNSTTKRERNKIINETRNKQQKKKKRETESKPT